MLISRATKMQLERNGFDVVGIAYNSETLWKLMPENPQVILMDIKLKRNENGIELAREIRKRFKTIPIIFTTGNSRKITEEETKNISNCAILSKPIVYQDLFENIRTQVASL